MSFQFGNNKKIAISFGKEKLNYVIAKVVRKILLKKKNRIV